MSECATSRHIFEPYCKGLGVDIGFGFDALIKTELGLTSDQPQPYTAVGKDKQIFRNDCRDFSFLCDETMNWVASHHLAEDFSYSELAQKIVPEWRRILKKGGLLLTNCPDQQRFLAHCARTGQGTNDAHLEQDFSLATWNRHVVAHTGPWEIVLEVPEHGPYSFLQILRKL